MTTSSRELTSPVSAGTAQSVQRAKTRSGKASTEILRGSADTRDRLADAREALALKVDLPARVEDAVHATKETVQAKVTDADGAATAGARRNGRAGFGRVIGAATFTSQE